MASPSDQLDAFIEALAGVPQVLVLTDHAQRSWIAGNNQHIAALQGTYPNVLVGNWDALAADCPGSCFYDDGIHLRPDGQSYYAALIQSWSGSDLSDCVGRPGSTGHVRGPAPTIDPMTTKAAVGRPHAATSTVPLMPGLDGMPRARRVAVMVYHADNAWLPGGFIGVEVFFVISGYLITLLLIGEHEHNGRDQPHAFWAPRPGASSRRLPDAVAARDLHGDLRSDVLGQLRGDVIAALTYVTNWYQIWVGVRATRRRATSPRCATCGAWPWRSSSTWCGRWSWAGC